MNIKLPESLGDLTLENYFNIMRIIEKLPKDMEDNYFATIEGQLVFFDLVEAICGEEINDLLLSELESLSENITSLINGFSITEKSGGWFECEGVVYATSNLSELTAGEYISTKIYQEKLGDDMYKYAPYLLAIVCRPATLIKDNETGIESWVVEKFDKKDINNLEWRANQFLKKVKAKDLMPSLNFFLNMKRKI